MGKISLYDQQQLASPAVGTPGVDTSGQQLGNAVADASDSAVTDITELQKQKSVAAREQAILDKQLQTDRRNTATTSLYWQYSKTLNDADNQARTDNMSNPGLARSALESQIPTLRDKFMAQADPTDPLAKTHLAAKLDEAEAQQVKSQSDWAATRTPTLMEDNFKGGAGALAARFGSMSVDPASAPQVYQDIHNLATQFVHDNLANAQRLYGDERGPEEIHKAISSALTSRLAAVANTGGDNAVNQLETEIKHFGDAIDPKQSHEYLNQLRVLAAQQQQAVKHDQVIQGQSADLSALATVTSTGKSIDQADPKTINAALGTPGITPAMKMRLTAAMGSAAQNQVKVQAKQISADNELKLVHQIGSYAAESDRLHDQVRADYAGLAGKFGADREAQMVRLAQSMDRYTRVHEQVVSSAGSLHSQPALDAVKGIVSKGNNDLQLVSGLLAKDPKAQQFLTYKDTFRTTIGNPPTTYQGPQQQVFNYYWRKGIEENFANAARFGNINTIMNSKKNMDQIRANLRAYASHQAELGGFQKVPALPGAPDVQP